MAYRTTVTIHVFLAAMFLFSCTVSFKVTKKDGSEDGISDPDGTDSDASSCGNMIVESELGEECDDGANGDDLDGCTDLCRFSCTDDSDCRDGDICNGMETCNVSTHACGAGAPLDDGTVCGSEPRSICLSGACSESACGDAFVDTGAGEMCDPPEEGLCSDGCVLLCGRDEDCPDDANACNGEEYCEIELGLCAHRDALEDGTECGSDPRRICIGWTCQPSLCGDGFIDTVSGEECEDGNTDQGDGCDNDCTFSCHDDGDCDDLQGCTTDQCSPSDHTCSHELLDAGAVCRPAAGECDLAEQCDGASAVCPDNAFVSSLTVCRVAIGACDLEERCTGSAALCPDDEYRPDTAVCRPAALSCDVAETCTGDSPTCPPDENDCPCTGDADCPDDGEACNGTEYCDTTVWECGHRDVPADGTECGTSPRRICIQEVCQHSECGDGVTDPGAGEECDDGNGIGGDGCEDDCTYSCHDDGECVDSQPCTDDLCDPVFHSCRNPLKAAGTVCRPAGGVCDVEETCDGLLPSCPANAYLTSATVCREARGECDMEEHCTGVSASCPADQYHPSTTVCRPAAGTCDMEETCTGDADACPADEYYSSATVCRAAAGPCDAAESCSGTSASCPANGFLPTTTVCRPSTAACDPEETCTGSSAACPDDVSDCDCTSDAQCPDDGNVCNGDEYCDTDVGQCSRRNIPPNGTVCNVSPRRICLNQVCADSECGDGFRDVGAGEECDDGNAIEGDGCDNDCTYSCHGDAECADSFACTNDYCNPTLHRCENDIRPATSLCRPSAGACDLTETCDGTSPLCPPDQYRPSGYVCRPSVDDCDLTETCTGSSPYCPADTGKTYTYETPSDATANSQWSTNGPENAIDLNETTSWFSESHHDYVEEWIYFDLGTKKCMDKMHVRFSADWLPAEMDLQVSDDAATWITIESGLAIPRPPEDGYFWMEEAFTPSAGRYLKLRWTDYPRNRGGHCVEMEVHTAPYP